MKKVILAFSLLASFATVSAQETKKVDSSKAVEVKKEVAKPTQAAVKEAPIEAEKAEVQKMEAEKKAKTHVKDAKLYEKSEAKPQ